MQLELNQLCDQSDWRISQHCGVTHITARTRVFMYRIFPHFHILEREFSQAGIINYKAGHFLIF